MRHCLDDRRTRNFVLLSLGIVVLGILFILDYTGYPFAPYRYWVLEYFLRTQDIPGSALMLALLLAACIAPGKSAALRLVDAVARHPWPVAGATFVLLCLGTLYVAQDHALAQDEYAALFQSKAFAAGHLTGLYPADLLGRLIPPHYMNQFFYGSFQTGAVASAYWPGYALILTPFSLAQAAWACNALLAALALVLAGRIAEQLTGESRARGWAMLLALGSPALGAMAISYFSMTAHLLLNLVFAWLLLQPSPRRLALAGMVGSLALVLHNPLPHALFALPWIAWIALQPGRTRGLFALAAGYAPLAATLGFGWALLLSDIQGNTLHGLYPFDDNPLHRVANFFWTWHVKMRTAVTVPDGFVLASRLAELVRLWCWAVPGLPLLAAAGWWLGRGDPRVLLLGLSLIFTFAGYWIIGFNQGHGWGARYLHPAWGALPILAAVALVRVRENVSGAPLSRYVASLAVLSLVFATSLRAQQIHVEIDSHLAHRPPALPGARQIVFVAQDLPNYTADLVQNDPFLRNPVWFLFSLDPKRDADLVRTRFPGARFVHGDRRGEVWRLDPP